MISIHRKWQGKGYFLNLASHLNLLTPKQMLQRLPAALVQVNVLNEILQNIYSLYKTSWKH